MNVLKEYIDVRDEPSLSENTTEIIFAMLSSMMVSMINGSPGTIVQIVEDVF